MCYLFVWDPQTNDMEVGEIAIDDYSMLSEESTSRHTGAGGVTIYIKQSWNTLRLHNDPFI